MKGLLVQLGAGRRRLAAGIPSASLSRHASSDAPASASSPAAASEPAGAPEGFRVESDTLGQVLVPADR